MRIALVTDAWAPQVNGVVRTLQETVLRLIAEGHEVDVIAPEGFATLPCPTYPEIRLALFARRRVRRRLADFAPDCVHISTEGPLGIVARKACLDWGWSFTTAFHTRFADYAAARTGINAARFWRYLRWFHGPSQTVMAATEDLRAELASHGLTRSHQWSRGVDMNRFSPDHPLLSALEGLPRPLLLSVGRVAVEKNLDAFLSLPIAGTKVVVGDGPALPSLRAAYPQAVFLGALAGQRLAQAYASCDVFVFPSKTDTFGLVMIEALASGTPVAAYPVTGPLAVFGESCPAVALDADLQVAVQRALQTDPAVCLSEARRFDWNAATRQFLAGLVAVRSAPELAAA